MPRQDAYGRWISDDGALYWDGRAWQPVATPTGYPGYAPMIPGTYAVSSSKGSWALGLGIASLFLWLLPILGLPVSIAAVALGRMALTTSTASRGRWGFILGLIGLALSVVNAALGVYLALNKPA
ncbi:MAG TPA: hypothetical protein VJQ08_05870 [Candidatus Dormibacteraeota bacterium]|nr:hypothetical protein [Candidatus Dormibacteraeota bacterium]